MKKSILSGALTFLSMQLMCPAIEVGGAAATDVSNWTTNNAAYVQGTTDGFSINWENVITNTASANVANNNFDVAFETNTNFVIGHLFLYNQALDLSTLPAGGIEKLSWVAEFTAGASQNWIPVIAITDAGTTTFYRSNNNGNSWRDGGVQEFAFGNATDASWVDLVGAPAGIIEGSLGATNPDFSSTTGMMQFGFIQWNAATSGTISPVSEFTTAIEQFDVSINVDEPPQEITAMKSSTEFPTKYAGNEIYDGISFINDWNLPTTSGTNVVPSLDEPSNILTVTNADNNGYFQQDNEISPWEVGVASGGSFTVEVRVKLANDGGNGFVVWAGNGSQLGVLRVNANSVQMLDVAEVLDTSDNTDDFHTFRLVYDAGFDRYFVWRDGVSLTPMNGRPKHVNTGLGQNRLIIGDCCSSYLMTSIDVDYIRYDTTGSFARPEVPLEITNIDYDLATNLVSLTWRSTPGALYFVEGSIDMASWPIEVGDLMGEAEAEETTVMFEAEFETPAEENPTEIFYRVRAG